MFGYENKLIFPIYVLNQRFEDPMDFPLKLLQKSNDQTL